MAELIREKLSLGRLSDADEGVVDLEEMQPLLGHLPGESLVAIDSDLDDEEEPRLQTDVDQAELGMQEVVVQRERYS